MDVWSKDSFLFGIKKQRSRYYVIAKSEAISLAEFAVPPEGLFGRLRDFYIFFLTILIMDVPRITKTCIFGMTLTVIQMVR